MTNGYLQIRNITHVYEIYHQPYEKSLNEILKEDILNFVMVCVVILYFEEISEKILVTKNLIIF